ncbi:MAG TPA: DUF1905 domain-containing protein [Trebonia sp.]|nr:DUF1905 domain-containing protein [Trebonia sp.]
MGQFLRHVHGVWLAKVHPQHFPAHPACALAAAGRLEQGPAVSSSVRMVIVASGYRSSLLSEAGTSRASRCPDGRRPGCGRSLGPCPLHTAPCGAGLAWQARSVKVVFNAELWLWDARRTETWTFVSLPASQSEEIRDPAGGLRHGFGSVRVRATIGNSTWTTSIFPASQAGYVLPVKRPIRVAESLDVGDMATVTVELIGFT